ncbi:hypothetical protein THAOC_24315, partial [Thalassiosira oceanica]
PQPPNTSSATTQARACRFPPKLSDGLLASWATQPQPRPTHTPTATTQAHACRFPPTLSGGLPPRLMGDSASATSHSNRDDTSSNFKL